MKMCCCIVDFGLKYRYVQCLIFLLCLIKDSIYIFFLLNIVYFPVSRKLLTISAILEKKLDMKLITQGIDTKKRVSRRNSTFLAPVK